MLRNYCLYYVISCIVLYYVINHSPPNIYLCLFSPVNVLVIAVSCQELLGIGGENRPRVWLTARLAPSSAGSVHCDWCSCGEPQSVTDRYTSGREGLAGPSHRVRTCQLSQFWLLIGRPLPWLLGLQLVGPGHVLKSSLGPLGLLSSSWCFDRQRACLSFFWTLITL